MEDVPAADELIAGDGGVGEEDGDDAEDAGGLIVACFEQIGDCELGELAGAGRDEVDEQKPSPAAASLSESSKAMLIGVFRTCEERAGANPGRQESEHKNEGGKRAAGDEVVRFGFHLAEATEGDTEKGENDEDKYDRVKVHGLGTSVLYRRGQESRTTVDRRRR